MAAVALISGGLDSIVATAMAAAEGDVVLGLTVEYGQHAGAREVEASRRVCALLGIPHEVLAARWLAERGGSALFGDAGALPSPADDDLDGPAAEHSAAAVWVPNRNGLLLNMAAARAEALGASSVVVGFNVEEAATFADNSLDFIAAVNRALAFSTRNRVSISAPVGGMTKREIVLEARRIGAPIEHAWPCYRGGDDLCGGCESCKRFVRALETAELASWYNDRRRALDASA